VTGAPTPPARTMGPRPARLFPAWVSDTRDSGRLGECRTAVAGLGVETSAAGHDDGLLRCSQALDGAGRAAGSVPGAGRARSVRKKGLLAIVALGLHVLLECQRTARSRPVG